ncbi:MAG: hypothetical protein J6L85_07000 [Clostridia bacterium]|nr:hypothetical protein [Clostridia bacterium]
MIHNFAELLVMLRIKTNVVSFEELCDKLLPLGTRKDFQRIDLFDRCSDVFFVKDLLALVICLELSQGAFCYGNSVGVGGGFVGVLYIIRI